MGNNNQNQRGNNQQQQSDKLRITVNDNDDIFLNGVEKFERTMTSREFCETIVNPLFKCTFKDFDGSYCTLMNTTQGPKMFVDLHFSKSNQISNAGYDCLIEKSVALKSNGDTFSRVMALSNKINSNRIYDMTREAKELLSEFNPGEKDPNKIKWKDKMVETNEQSVNGIGNTAVVKLITFDPVSIARCRLGNRLKINGKDRYVEYTVDVIKHIQNVYNPNGGVELLLKVTAYDKENAQKSIMSSGLISQYGANPMYRACNV